MNHAQGKTFCKMHRGGRIPAVRSNPRGTVRDGRASIPVMRSVCRSTLSFGGNGVAIAALARLHEQQSRLYAPVAGTVQQLVVQTIGDAVQTGQQPMIVVPHGSELEIGAMLPNKDKGFVQPDKNACIKAETFPFTKYGVINGEVLDVSNDAVSESRAGGAQTLVFPVRVNLARDRMVIEYLLTPLLRYRDEALRER